ncbi:MAG: Rrf2 family transcriptional regulator [Caldiserica bacterium]|jgi:Rrf2 family protein|nr:Rrf2 family transcriptional regulator [Caldisericota bacterium]MDH7562099.1 Rrf2 family transcriptional regulator [Caldisericota bacterium]
MKISARGEYGLKVMAFLAFRGEKPLKLKALSRECGVPYPFLARIMVDLKKASLLRSFRGSQGGYVLGKNPREIKIREIIEALDGRISLVDCLKDKARCPNPDDCLTRPFWRNLNLSFQRMLEISLADLIEGKKEESI